MQRFSRIALLLGFAVGWSFTGPVFAQSPIPTSQYIQIFRSMSPAEQRSLIRDLQSQLPPGQREELISMLMEQQGGGDDPGGIIPSEGDVDIDTFAQEIVAGFEGEFEEEDGRLDIGDTIMLQFTPGETGVDPEFLMRLQDGNPYELDGAGRLLLPGVPAIELAGLNVDEATIRVAGERALRPLSIVLTRLPLDPVGTQALKPFAHDIFRNARSTFLPSTDVPVPADYVIGPGDVINVLLVGGENVEHFLEVTRDGTINFPDIGPLSVSGLEFAEVRELINERVSEQMIGVRASTTLGELRSIRVYVTGDVLRPGSFTVSSLATMTNALFASGGVSKIGTLRRIELRRNNQVAATLDLYDLLLRGDMGSNARVQPEDTIFVPTIGPTVAVDGDVRRPAIYELRGGETVGDIIALAGGLLASADPGDVRLERIVPGRGVSVVGVDLGAPAASATALRDGDTVRVARNLEQLEGTVRLVGNVQREGLYPWREGMTISDLLPRPELVKPQSDLRYVLIRREPTTNVDVEALSVDLQAIWERRPGAADLALQSRDTVYVFHQETGRQQYVQPLVEELESQSGPSERFPLVRIRGPVRAEGEYPLEPGMRISDLLRAGGGLTDAAYGVEAELTRYNVLDGEYLQTELLTVDLAGVSAGMAEADMALSPYDALTIREISRWGQQEVVTLRGEVNHPGEYVIRPDETLHSVLTRAGGLTEFAFAEGAVFTRVAAAERERAEVERLARRLEADLSTRALADENSADALQTGQALLAQLRDSQPTGRTVIRLDEVVDGNDETPIALRGGDVLIVPKRSQEVTVIGEVQYQTTHIYDTDLDRDAYVARSGGLTSRADKGRVYIVRANGEVVTDDGGRWFRRDAGFEVRPGDTIVAPLDVTRMRPLTLWTSVTQIVYSMAIAAAAVSSF